MMRRIKGLVPLLISASLVSWLVYRIEPDRLLNAFAQLAWAPLVAVTCLLVLALYLWDGVCVWWLFAEPRRPLNYLTVLRARGCAYLFTILHFGLGQGLLAWLMAKAQDKSVVSAAGRFLILVYVDVGVLLSLGLLGASLSHDPRTEGIALFCGVALACLALLTLLMRLLPQRMIKRLSTNRLATELALADLPFRRVAALYPLRAVYFVLGMLHAGTVIWLCGVSIDHSVVLSVIPLTSLVDGLPISVAGLGTREAILLEMLAPEEPAMLLAGSLIWWTVVVTGRAMIGLVLLWYPQMPSMAGDGSSAGRLAEPDDVNTKHVSYGGPDCT